MNKLLVELTEMCKHHDWYYEFSDDHSVWRRGGGQRAEIRNKLKECEEAGLGEEANNIYNEYRPEIKW